MKKSPKVIQYIPFGIFPLGMTFCCGFSYEEIVKQLKKNKADEWVAAIKHDEDLINSGWCALKREVDGVQYYYICIRNKFDFTPKSYVALAHEILHISQFFLPQFLDRDREIEAEAYFHTYLMTECLKVLGAKI